MKAIRDLLFVIGVIPALAAASAPCPSLRTENIYGGWEGIRNDGLTAVRLECQTKTTGFLAMSGPGALATVWHLKSLEEANDTVKLSFIRTGGQKQDHETTLTLSVRGNVCSADRGVISGTMIISSPSHKVPALWTVNLFRCPPDSVLWLKWLAIGSQNCKEAISKYKNK